MDFNTLKKNLKKETEQLKHVKLAILGDSATQFIAQAIRGLGIDYSSLLLTEFQKSKEKTNADFNIEIFEADFNQIDQQILDPTSELYAFEPDYVLIFESTHKLLQKYNKQDTLARSLFAKTMLEHTVFLAHTLEKKTNAKLIYCNYTEEDDCVFGQYASKVEQSFPYQLRTLNYHIQEYALQTPNFFICDLSAIQNHIGRDKFWAPAIYTNTEMVVSIDALPYFAKSVVQIIASFQGVFKKCIILDLDNTLWGGVIGDDGIENIQVGQLGIGKAFTELQYWVKKLHQRGIIVAVCSKNTESVAKEPFEKHPDMVLCLKDIAVFVANWENKADNIRHIQNVLNIGFDAMVFVDDNPFERNLVRENIPQITVPEMPEDPALYLDYLYSLNLFETVSFSGADLKRTQQYQKEALRISTRESFTNEDQFLESLNMLSDTKPFDTFSIPRVSQLSQRSNQFNLRTIRYTEEDVRKITKSDDFFTLSFTLEDKFGDNGLICVVILEKQDDNSLFIDTWLMSCRVLKRDVESYTLNTIIDLAQQNGYSKLIGEYIPSPKNEMVRDHYKKLGFEAAGENKWILHTTNYKEKTNYIKRKNDE